MVGPATVFERIRDFGRHPVAGDLVLVLGGQAAAEQLDEIPDWR